MRFSIASVLATQLAAAAVATLMYAALSPIDSVSSERVFEIPNGTWARRMRGENLEILPREIRLTIGVEDVLLLRNLDVVPHMLGPTLVMPGQEFRLPFQRAATYYFACSAHSNGQLTITVDAQPLSAWDRINWRVRAILETR